MEQTTFASRVQEGKDLRSGMETIRSKLKVLQDEEDNLRKKLAQVMKTEIMHAKISRAFVGAP